MLVAKLESFANNSMGYFLSAYLRTNVHSTLTLAISENAGLIGVFVDAKDEYAAAYYQQYEFISLGISSTIEDGIQL